jgi:transposase
MLCTTLLTAFTSPIAVSARERLRGAVVRGVHGKLITHLAARHRHQEWLAFLKLIDQQSPPDLDIHIIADNYATHKHPRVNKWLQRQPRFHMHYMPTSSSWINLVERFFGELTPFINENSFTSTRERADAIVHLSDGAQRQSSTLRLEGRGRRHLAQNRRGKTGACPPNVILFQRHHASKAN